MLLNHYLGNDDHISNTTIDFIKNCQDEETGYFVGPELRNWEPGPDSVHNKEHILRHLTSAALPVLQQFGISSKYPLISEYKYLETDFLENWFNQVDWKNPWLEGNNLLFTGQFLIYLRDFEEKELAQKAIDYYFGKLDNKIDPLTGLWGTDEGASVSHAIYGGYHQLLVYYYENHPHNYKERLIDSVLSIQHSDGGFKLNGNAGACEDVDAIDILVNLYKRGNYRKSDILIAVEKCLRHIKKSQLKDGGFPYSPARKPFYHMKIPDTYSGPGYSNMFSTWFRTHTIALIMQILEDKNSGQQSAIHFSNYLSMGWHDTSIQAKE